MIYQTNWLKIIWRFHWKWRSNWNWRSDGRLKISLKISLKMKISHFQLPSEPPKLPAGDQRTWILEVDCFPLLRPGNVERSVTGGGVQMVWKGGGWINCMMEKSPASALTSASKCWEKMEISIFFSMENLALNIWNKKVPSRENRTWGRKRNGMGGGSSEKSFKQKEHKLKQHQHQSIWCFSYFKCIS